MTKTEFIKKAVQLTKDYTELHDYCGLIDLTVKTVQLNENGMLTWFSPDELEISPFDSDIFPVRMSVFVEDVEFFCLSEKNHE